MLRLITVASGQTDTAGAWLWQAMTSRLSLICMAIIIVSVIALLLCLRGMVRIGIAAYRSRAVRTGQSGTTTMEFLLVLPVAMFFVGLIAQTTFLMTGNIMVHYAAFCATRAAIVQVSDDPVFQAETRQNEIGGTDADQKYRATRLAAVIALMPVSGPSTDKGGLGKNVADGIAQFYQAYGKDAPHWTKELIAQRLNYADANTQIQFYESTPDGDRAIMRPITGGHTYGPKDTITVEVSHRFYLSIPWVSYVFRDSNASQPYTTIQAHYSLPNEGIGVLLPPRPDIDRVE